MRKKIITDYFDLPNFDKDLKYTEKKVLEEMNIIHRINLFK